MMMVDQEPTFELFLLEIARQVAVLLTPEARDFLAAKCEDFFRAATACHEKERAARQEAEQFASKKGYYVSLSSQPGQSGIYRKAKPGQAGPADIQPVLVKPLPSFTNEDPSAMFPYGGWCRRGPRDDTERFLRDCIRTAIIHDVEFRDNRTIYFFRGAGSEMRTPLDQTPDEFAEWVHRSLVEIASILSSRPHELASLKASFQESAREVQAALETVGPPDKEPGSEQTGHGGDSRDATRFASPLIPRGSSNVNMQSMERNRVEAHSLEQGKPTPPTGLISSAVAVKDYSVSRATLRRAVAKKRLRDYRPEGHSRNAPLQLSRAEVANIWPKRGQ